MWEIVNHDGTTLIRSTSTSCSSAPQSAEVQRQALRAWTSTRPTQCCRPTTTWRCPWRSTSRASRSPRIPTSAAGRTRFRMNPGEVTRILSALGASGRVAELRVRRHSRAGYVWHCHILEHERTIMMRPRFMLVAPTPMVARTTPVMGVSRRSHPPRRGVAGRVSQPVAARSDHPVPACHRWTRVRRALRCGRTAGEDSRARRRSAQASIRWRGPVTTSGRALTTGVYFVRLRTPEATLVVRTALRLALIRSKRARRRPRHTAGPPRVSASVTPDYR